MNFNEEMKKAKDGLKALLNADNTEAVTGLVAVLDSLSAEHKKTVDKVGELQETVVNYVKNTAFNSPSGEDQPDETKSLDDLLADELEKIIQKQKK